MRESVCARANVVCPEQRLSIRDALRTYTIWAAKHVFMEDKIGSLEVGKYADMVLWDRDLYSIPTREIRDIKAMMTILNGTVVFKA